MKSYGNNTHSVEKFHIFFKKIYKKQHNMVTGIISFTIFHSFVLLTSYICIYCVPKLDFSVLFLLFFSDVPVFKKNGHGPTWTPRVEHHR